MKIKWRCEWTFFLKRRVFIQFLYLHGIKTYEGAQVEACNSRFVVNAHHSLAHAFILYKCTRECNG